MYTLFNRSRTKIWRLHFFINNRSSNMYGILTIMTTKNYFLQKKIIMKSKLEKM